MRFSDKNVWQRIKLNEYADFLQGLTYSPNNVSTTGRLVLRSSNIQNSKLAFDDNVYVNMNIPAKISTKENDVLMCVRNGSKNLVGKTALITKEFENLAWGAFMNIIRPKDGKTLLFHFLNSQYFKNQIKADLNTATVNQITIGTLNQCKISIPLSEIEKDKLCIFFNLLDQRIDTQSKIIEDLQTLKISICDKVFEDTTYPEYKLKDVLSERIEKSNVNNQYEILSSTIKGLFTQKEYFDKDIASSNNIGYKIVHLYDIIISPQNLWMGNITFNQRFTNGLVSPSYKIYIINNNFDMYYIANMLKTKRAMYKYICSSQQGASVVRRNLNMDDFLSLSFCIPDINKQRKIGLLLNTIDKRIDLEQTYLTKLNQQKKFLLKNMFI